MCIVSQNKYGYYCVPESSKHRPAAKKILSNKVYEPNTIEFILSNNLQGNIIHAGAYFGDFLPALSAKNSRVYAFEPNNENFECANLTLELNKIENVELYNFGLGEEHCNLPLKIKNSQVDSIGGASHIVKGSNENTQNVEIFAIDDIIDPKELISIIHLDIEGFEKEALKGAKETIERCLPIIIVEDLSGDMQDWILETFSLFGYYKYTSMEKNLVFISNL